MEAVARVASREVTPQAAFLSVIVAHASALGSLNERPTALCVWMSMRPGAM